MAIEIVSRVLAVFAAIGFTLVFTTGRLPIIPKGRWTVVALFAVGLGMCTVAGMRDELGATLSQPAWLTGVFTALGFSAFGVLLAVLIGMSWRIGVVGLAVLIGASWILALGWAVYAGLDTALLGVATLLVVVGASLTFGRMPLGRLDSAARAAS
jgi:hypothetical protein